MRRTAVALALAGLAAGPALAGETDPLVLRAFAPAMAECEAEGGTLRLPENPVSEVDLTGDGRPDRIVSEAGAFCGPDLGYLGGSAGNRLHAIIGDHVQALEWGNWAVADVVFTVEGEALPPRRILLLAVHGAYCESFGAAPCVIAYGWDGTRLISVMDLLEAML